MIPEAQRIYPGDCLTVMATWQENFVDTIITDPPYGLEFMGKDWDRGVPGIHFWAEMLRIAKPGSLLMAFGGTRTYHRMTVAIEDAGWEIRDCMMWLYGSGFPKSLDISKAIDKANGAERKLKPRVRVDGRVCESPDWAQGWKNSSPNGLDCPDPITDLARQWSGWGTALKPAWEPIIVAMKPIDGTFAQNAEKWGVAGINVDGGRIGYGEAGPDRPLDQVVTTDKAHWGNSSAEALQKYKATGRWPANLLLDEDAAAMLDGCDDQFIPVSSVETNASSSGAPEHDTGNIFGASRFFYVAKSSRAERNEGCQGMEEKSWKDQGFRDNDSTHLSPRAGAGRTSSNTNHHPTVKPLELMKYLCMLTKTPTGGIVLDPFAGSGTTLWAAEYHNRPWIGIEMNPEYVAIAEARIARERSQMKMAI